ncbi:MAG: FecR domain-containing protein [Niastella sp.]|nr:FecR domain-containing protein [Niastella sp.]
MLQEERIINIIVKDQRGQATAEELALLNQWLSADPANRQEYGELVLAWQESGRLMAGQTFDTNAAWSKIATRTGAGNTKETPVRHIRSTPFLSRKRWMLAAAVIAIFIIGGYLWNHYNTTWQELVAYNNQTLRLPDGSTVQLRKGAIIRYPLTFEGAERLVHLTGEAFFDVQRNETHPFIINTSHAAVKVLGTSFLVNTTKETDEVIVVTGRVSVTSSAAAGRQVQLKAGERTILQNDEFRQSKVPNDNYIAWNTGLLDFKNAPLTQVLEDMQDYYEVPITLDNQHQEAIAAINITVRFDHQPLEQALEEIRLITGLSMKKDAGKVVFYMK